MHQPKTTQLNRVSLLLFTVLLLVIKIANTSARPMPAPAADSEPSTPNLPESGTSPSPTQKTPDEDIFEKTALWACLKGLAIAFFIYLAVTLFLYFGTCIYLQGRKLQDRLAAGTRSVKTPQSGINLGKEPVKRGAAAKKKKDTLDSNNRSSILVTISSRIEKEEEGLNISSDGKRPDEIPDELRSGQVGQQRFGGRKWAEDPTARARRTRPSFFMAEDRTQEELTASVRDSQLEKTETGTAQGQQSKPELRTAYGKSPSPSSSSSGSRSGSSSGSSSSGSYSGSSSSGSRTSSTSRTTSSRGSRTSSSGSSSRSGSSSSSGSHSGSSSTGSASASSSGRSSSSSATGNRRSASGGRSRKSGR